MVPQGKVKVVQRENHFVRLFDEDNRFWYRTIQQRKQKKNIKASKKNKDGCTRKFSWIGVDLRQTKPGILLKKYHFMRSELYRTISMMTEWNEAEWRPYEHKYANCIAFIKKLYQIQHKSPNDNNNNNNKNGKNNDNNPWYSFDPNNNNNNNNNKNGNNNGNNPWYSFDPNNNNNKNNKANATEEYPFEDDEDVDLEQEENNNNNNNKNSNHEDDEEVDLVQEANNNNDNNNKNSNNEDDEDEDVDMKQEENDGGCALPIHHDIRQCLDRINDKEKKRKKRQSDSAKRNSLVLFGNNAEFTLCEESFPGNNKNMIKNIESIISKSGHVFQNYIKGRRLFNWTDGNTKSKNPKYIVIGNPVLWVKHLNSLSIKQDIKMKLSNQKKYNIYIVSIKSILKKVLNHYEHPSLMKSLCQPLDLHSWKDWSKIQVKNNDNYIVDFGSDNCADGIEIEDDECPIFTEMKLQDARNTEFFLGRYVAIKKNPHMWCSEYMIKVGNDIQMGEAPPHIRKQFRIINPLAFTFVTQTEYDRDKQDSTTAKPRWDKINHKVKENTGLKVKYTIKKVLDIDIDPESKELEKHIKEKKHWFIPCNDFAAQVSDRPHLCGGTHWIAQTIELIMDKEDNKVVAVIWRIYDSFNVTDIKHYEPAVINTIIKPVRGLLCYLLPDANIPEWPTIILFENEQMDEVSCGYYTMMVLRHYLDKVLHDQRIKDNEKIPGDIFKINKIKKAVMQDMDLSYRSVMSTINLKQYKDDVPFEEGDMIEFREREPGEGIRNGLDHDNKGRDNNNYKWISMRVTLLDYNTDTMQLSNGSRTVETNIGLFMFQHKVMKQIDDDDEDIEHKQDIEHISVIKKEDIEHKEDANDDDDNDNDKLKSGAKRKLNTVDENIENKEDANDDDDNDTLEPEQKKRKLNTVDENIENIENIENKDDANANDDDKLKSGSGKKRKLNTVDENIENKDDANDDDNNKEPEPKKRKLNTVDENIENKDDANANEFSEFGFLDVWTDSDNIIEDANADNNKDDANADKEDANADNNKEDISMQQLADIIESLPFKDGSQPRKKTLNDYYEEEEAQSPAEFAGNNKKIIKKKVGKKIIGNSNNKPVRKRRLSHERCGRGGRRGNGIKGEQGAKSGRDGKDGKGGRGGNGIKGEQGAKSGRDGRGGRRGRGGKRGRGGRRGNDNNNKNSNNVKNNKRNNVKNNKFK